MTARGSGSGRAHGVPRLDTILSWSCRLEKRDQREAGRHQACEPMLGFFLGERDSHESVLGRRVSDWSLGNVRKGVTAGESLGAGQGRP